MPIVRRLIALQKLMFNQRYLLATNIFISSTISAAGDVIEQTYQNWRTDFELDTKRTGRMAIGGVTMGAICHYWYKNLDRYLTGTNYRVVTLKVFLDQTICSPVYITAFFMTLGWLEGGTTDEVISNVRLKAWRLYIAEWTTWPLAQFINFMFVPPRYRILYIKTISLAYGILTSHIAHSEQV